ncbi:PREDICTED: histone H3.v1-like [Nicotiana attenuata]|nr:PREDICTED: histone H3.v1-like [Nicotiana attenuata]
MLLNPEKPRSDEIDSASDEEEDEVIDSASDEEEDQEIDSGGGGVNVEKMDSVGDEEIDSASDIEEDEEINSGGGAEFSVDDTEKSCSRFQEADQEICHIVGLQGNYNVSKTKSTVLKVKLSLKKTRDIDDKLQHMHVDSDKEKKTEAEKCWSDSTESKNMSCVTGSATKNSPEGLRKMNEDINRVDESQDCSSQKIKRLEGGGQLQKQRNCSAITRPNQKTTQSSTVARPVQKVTQSSAVATPMGKTTQSSTVGRPMQKPAQSSTVATPMEKTTHSSAVARRMQKPALSSTVATPMEKTTHSSAVARPMQKPAQSCTVATLMQKPTQSGMKFESSKRKFEERVAEQKNAKRRIIMVDFHDMPKLAKDPSAPKRCWDSRRRF